MSEAVYHEYDELRQRYQVETESMAQAFNRATEVSIVVVLKHDISSKTD